MVTPSYMLNIADEFERQGLNPAESSLKIGRNRLAFFVANRLGDDRVELKRANLQADLAHNP